MTRSLFLSWMFAVGLMPAIVAGQKAASGAAVPPKREEAFTLTARSTNVSEPGNTVKINILRWSTEEERNALAQALKAPAPAPTAPAAAPVDGGGAARGGRAGAAGRGRGAAGRGARGGSAGGGAAALSPIAAFGAAISRSPTIGYIWTNEVIGYAIKYAFRSPLASGERIILATDRRFGANSAAWKPVANVSPTDYAFTVFELRIDRTGGGEGKASLTSSVVLDEETKTVALRDYAAAPPILVLGTPTKP